MDEMDKVVYYLHKNDNHLLGLLASVPKVCNPKLKTPTKMTGGRLEYNPELLAKLNKSGYRDGTDSHNASVQVLSELMHLGLLHPERVRNLGSSDKKRAYLAADLAIFGEIAHENPAFPQPEDFKLPRHLSAEEYFYKLQQDGKGGGQSDSQIDKKMKGKAPQDHSGWEESKEAEQQSMKYRAEEYANECERGQAEKRRGTDPLGIARLFKRQFRPPQEPWQKVLARIIGHKFSQEKTRYTVKRPSRRFGMPNPGRQKEKKGDLAIAIDTSGSIGERELEKFFQVAYHLSKLHQCPIRVICCDAAIHNDVVVKMPSDVEKIEPSGGGGTSSRPVFKALEKNPPQLLVFFTDLYTDFPEQPPRYDVIWATTNPEIEVPFGKKFSTKPDE